MNEEQNPPPPPVQPPPQTVLPGYYAQPQVEAAPNAFDKLIPTKNGQALAAYYLGVFSLIPCFGIALGIGAVVMGSLGLKAIKAKPGLPGKTHAIVGIVLGSLVLFGHIAAVIAIAIAAQTSP
jgi:hypothetical protein